MKCMWCENDEAKEGLQNCYWITPDGRLTVEILDIPSIDCPHCHDKYVSDEDTQKIEDALYLHDISGLGKTFTYKQLMEAPRINLFLDKNK
ncbi:YokU family protein [Aneurinibacillus tyrosinisolvens]|uniref:YokU family protein n=1 Tax=Aneurinibacillus tyrosinisolvens TaxID=1443435 RepID=UPI00063F5EEA|nr:YokU family protein [Aneurinibacillus tyrosinisolvens]